MITKAIYQIVQQAISGSSPMLVNLAYYKTTSQTYVVIAQNKINAKEFDDIIVSGNFGIDGGTGYIQVKIGATQVCEVDIVAADEFVYESWSVASGLRLEDTYITISGKTSAGDNFFVKDLKIMKSGV